MRSEKQPRCFSFVRAWKKTFSEICSSIKNAFSGCFGRRSSKLDHDADQSAVAAVSLTVKEDKENVGVPEAAQNTEPTTVPGANEAVPEPVPETAPVAATWANLNTPLTIFVLLCIAEVAADMAEMSNEEGTDEEE